MWLSIQCCTNLKKIEKASTNSDEPDPKNLLEAAEDEIKIILSKITEAGGNPGDALYKRLEKAYKMKEAALARRDDNPGVPPGDSETPKVVPNPYVVMSFDEDEEDDTTRPMLHTKALRKDTNPIWRERFEEFPIGLYECDKRAFEIFDGDEDYQPQNLTFTIYHDDGVPNPKTNKPELSDESWKRDTPSRKVPIGKAEWEYFDLCRKVNCPEFTKDLPVFNPNTHKRIKDATLTIKVRLCMPKLKIQTVEDCKECQGVKDDTVTVESPATPIKPIKTVKVTERKPLLRSRSRKNVFRKVCCSITRRLPRCTNVLTSTTRFETLSDM